MMDPASLISSSPSHLRAPDSPKPNRRKLLHLPIPTAPHIPLERSPFLVLVRVEQVDDPFRHRLLPQRLRRLDRVLARMNEDHDLVTRFEELGDLCRRQHCREGRGREAYLVERGVVERGAGLDASGFALDADKVLFEWDWTEGGVKVEEALVAVDSALGRQFGFEVRTEQDLPKEVGDVDVVWQRGGETDNADEALRRLDLSQGASDDAFDDGSSVLVQKMHLVDDEELDFLLTRCISHTSPSPKKRERTHIRHLSISRSCSLARHDVPLLRRRHNHASLIHLLLRHLHISRQLSHLDPRPREPFREFERNLGGEGFEWRDVDDLVGARGRKRGRGFADEGSIAETGETAEDREECDVRFALRKSVSEGRRSREKGDARLQWARRPACSRSWCRPRGRRCFGVD